MALRSLWPLSLTYGMKSDVHFFVQLLIKNNIFTLKVTLALTLDSLTSKPMWFETLFNSLLWFFQDGLSVTQLAFEKGTENIIRVVSGIGLSMVNNYIGR